MQIEPKLLPVWTIDVHGSHPRKRMVLGPLTRSIEILGVLEPLIVVPNSHGTRSGMCPDCCERVRRGPTGTLAEHVFDGRICAGGSGPAADDWWVVAGARRLLAARQAGLVSVPCIVRADLTTLGDRLVVAMAANLHVLPLKDDEAESGWAQLGDNGYAKGRAEHVLSAKRDPRPAQTYVRRVSAVQVRDLMPEVVQEIRERYAGGDRQGELAERYGVSEMSVRRIVNGSVWPDAPGPITRGKRRSSSQPAVEHVVAGVSDGPVVVLPADLPSTAPPVLPVVPRPHFSPEASPAPPSPLPPLSAICPSCSMQLPATGVCDDCA